VFGFDIDLTSHEMLRRAHVLEAADDFNPIKTLEDETSAWSMLYSNLDDAQQRVFDELRACGVL
jgi:hypothetical protein